MIKKMILLILLSPIAEAGTYTDAMRICQSMSFSSSRSECTDYILTQRHAFFDVSAINTCLRASFDSDKMTCVQAIAGKVYDPIEIRECSRRSFGSDIAECLGRYGTPYTPPPPSRPNPPRYQDDHDADYVRGRTQSWINLGNFQAPKGKTETLTFNLDLNRPMTEVRIMISKNKMKIHRAVVTTASNFVIRLNTLEGTFTNSNSVGATYQVGPRQALRVRQLTLEVESQELIGSRSQIEVLVGVSR